MPPRSMSSENYHQYFINKIYRESQPCGRIYKTLVTYQRILVEVKLWNLFPTKEIFISTGEKLAGRTYDLAGHSWNIEDYSWKLFNKLHPTDPKNCREFCPNIKEIKNTVNLDDVEFDDCIKELVASGYINLITDETEEDTYVSVDKDGVIYPFIFAYLLRWCPSWVEGMERRGNRR